MTMTLAVALITTLVLVVGGPVSAAAPRASTAQPPEGRPGQPIVVRWSTETEVGTAGFNVYRASNQDGPWEKINSRLIPGSTDPLRGGSYVYTDTNVIAGVTYWYELEEVELGGRAVRLEKTTATAQSTSPLASLPCASGLSLVLVSAVGVVVINRRKRPNELA
jgi:hypothetical protein